MDRQQEREDRLRQMDRKELGQRLRLARVTRGFRHQRDATRHLGFGPSFLSSIETGGTRPTLERLEQLAHLYGLEVDLFLTDQRPEELIRIPQETGEIDHVARAALLELNPVEQRLLVLEIWPWIRDVCARLQDWPALQNGVNQAS